MDKKIIAIVNPAAGSGKTARIWPEKSAYLKKSLINLRMFIPKNLVMQ
ncbi:hypothetical protein [Halanaerobium sp. ST460_2HS_T2]|nr:hypothetical protein [Halanaerobium sp. ST460_2HS_T2]RCW57449.1 hypothetical protein DFR80_11249 [Halanaerobium sp. ST460_2HS_T2]